MSEWGLSKLTEAERLLAEATVEQLAEVSELVDVAELARVFARQASLGTRSINHATKVKLFAERKVADLVDEGQATGKIAKQGGDRQSSGAMLAPPTLVELGIERSKLSEARAIRDTFTAEEIERVIAEADERDKEVSRKELLKAARQMRRRAVEHTPARPDASLPDADAGGGRVRLLHGDFRERLRELEPGSVDLIVTDPPYPKEDLPLWSDLAQVAARLLAPRGILFAWSGQLFLPEVLNRLGEHLTYGWTFLLDMHGPASRIMGRHIIQTWKPVVAFSTGTWPSGEWRTDRLSPDGWEKDLYEWQQSQGPAREIIDSFCPPDGLVVDPFMGVGSFGAAARDVGRRFVGVELDAGRFEQARGVIL